MTSLPARAGRIRLRGILALLLALFVAGCDEHSPPPDEFEHEPSYEVEYRITTAEGTAGALFVSTMGHDNLYVSEGRVRPPWQRVEELVSGRTARLRAWGLTGNREVLLDIVVQAQVRARLRMAPGQDLREVRFKLP